MKCFAVVATALAFALPAFAQDIRQLPQCAQGPVLDAISASGCPLTDIKCICANEGFISGLLKKLPTVCNANEIALSTDFATKLCGAAGVTLTLPGATPATTSSTTPSSASEAAATTSSAKSSSEAASTSSTAPSSTASETPAVTPNAAMMNTIDVKGLLGAVVMGLAAAL